MFSHFSFSGFHHPHICPLNPDTEKYIRLPLCIDVVECQSLALQAERLKWRLFTLKHWVIQGKYFKMWCDEVGIPKT